jgi:transposase
MTHRRRSPGPPAGAEPALLERINPNTAGLDCGAEMHSVAVPPARAASAVRAFQPFTAERHRVADWLTSCGVHRVAMESTGVYWIPLYEILESRGFAVGLVNARHVQNVPGRKTAVVDCQGLQQLHSVACGGPASGPPQRWPRCGAICDIARAWCRERRPTCTAPGAPPRRPPRIFSRQS